MKFDSYNLAPVIKKNLAELGFVKPTDIQYKSIPPILKGEDVLAIAQTGTGKTAAYAIPVVEMLFSKFVYLDHGVRCIVMVPTHELAIQVCGVFVKLAFGTDLQILSIFGGVIQEPQIAKLKKGVDILIATPGRLFDLESQGHLRMDKVEILILDEADHMLQLGFIHDMRQLVAKLPKHRQTLFFSATIDEQIKDLAYGLVRHAVRIQISPKDPVSKNVNHSVAFIEMDDKRFFLEKLIKEHPESKILVFVRTKVRAERVLKALERVGITCQTIHGDKIQDERTQVMKHFRSGDNKILIATDISARGIDIPNVEYVINYDLPEVSENYVHRVGRTGRGTQKGTAIAFCSKEEKPILEEIQQYLTVEIAVLNLHPTEYTEIVDESKESKHSWQDVISEIETYEKRVKKKKK